MKAILGFLVLLTGFSSVVTAQNVKAGIVNAKNDSTLSLAFGPSLPNSMQATTSIDPLNPSRAPGGEVISIQFKNPKTVESIKLSGFSVSGLGQVLMHDVQATEASPSGNIDFALGELFSFAQKGLGLYNDYEGKIMLANNNYVSTVVNRPLNQIRFHVEGFRNSDATLLIQVSTAEPLNYYDFNVTRTNRGDNNGGDNGDDGNGNSSSGSYYGWGQGQDGYGHCYEYASNGGALNEGSPVSDSNCRGAYYRWSQGQDGYTHCYEYGGGYVLNEGSPVSKSLCGG